MSNALARFDRTLVTLARRYGVLTLRIALGVVFIWFGVLKVADVSPVADLVADIVPILSDRAAVLAIGIVEVVVGLGLIVGFAIRLTLGLFFAQMLGTFFVLVLRPAPVLPRGESLPAYGPRRVRGEEPGPAHRRSCRGGRDPTSSRRREPRRPLEAARRKGHRDLGSGRLKLLGSLGGPTLR